jgi:hypothetical protein
MQWKALKTIGTVYVASEGTTSSAYIVCNTEHQINAGTWSRKTARQIAKAMNRAQNRITKGKVEDGASNQQQ